MTEHDMHNLAAAYALDALEPEEREAFEAHLASCGGCAAEIAEFRETAAALGETQAATPPAGLRDRVLADVRQTRQLPPEVATDPPIDLAERRSIGRFAKIALGSVAAAILAVAGLAILFAADDESVPPEVAAVYDADDSMTVQLLAQPETLDGLVEVSYSKSVGRAVVQGNDIGPLDDDTTFQLWAISSDRVEPAGVFVPDESGGVIEALAIDAPADAVWGITVEPEGGSPQPTGDILYLSS